MKKQALNTNRNKHLIILTVSIAVTILIAVFLYIFVFNTKPKANTSLVQKNEDNAKVIEAEKEKEAVVITDETSSNTNESEIQEENENSIPQPTYDQYGQPSTKLDRGDVHAVVLAVYQIYRDYLYKLQITPVDQRQLVADQYLAENSSYFSSTFNYLSSDSLHLFPQSANVALPNSVRTYSAIVDPDNPNQVIVQLIMEPDTSWSILVVVKVKDSLGNFGTIEKLIPRMNRNPL